MNTLIVCRIAWSIASLSGHGSWDTDVTNLKKWTDIGNSEYGAGTHQMQCQIPYTQKAPEFKNLVMPA